MARNSIPVVELLEGVCCAPLMAAPDPVQAALWGLVRTAQNEHPDRFTLLDTDQRTTEEQVASALTAPGREHQIALRRGVVHVPRLTRTGALSPPAGAEVWRLETAGRGSLDTLTLVAAPPKPLLSGQVRIDVRAAGLNFHYVVVALSLIDDKGGGEAAGVVTEVGAGVEGIAVGDAVMGLVPDMYASSTVADHRMIAAIPDGWSFTQAASAPVAYLTAFHSLVELAGLGRGDRVLIHAGTGGVGIAAIRIAQRLGADVFATASPAKWDVRRGLGLPDDHIASSRSLDFRDAFLGATQGAGVDVVLNCLAGESIDASLELLPRGGHFLEIGKTDLRDEAPGGVAYHAIDLVRAAPEDIARMLARLMPLFRSGALRPLPTTTYPVEQAPQAFRDMSQARHTGKIVLTARRSPDPGGTVLITGGTGVLGGLLARHLVTRYGVRHLLLVSRSGPLDLVPELEALGAQVTVSACDVGDRDAVAALIASVPRQHPLTMVVHAAAELSDAPLTDLTADDVERVLRAKADGAWFLHEQTRHLDLAAFVVYSAMAGTLGAPGQANYAAANAFCDALAEHRHRLGLPATSLAWGYWAVPTGLTGHLSAADTGRITGSGLLPITTEAGLALFDAALAGGHPTYATALFDPAGLARRARGGTLPAMLSSLVTGARQHVIAARRASSGAGTPAALTPEQVLALVRSHTAGVLGHATPDSVHPDQPFKALGIDSLTALELRNHLNAATGLRLGATTVFDHPTPAALAAHLRSRLGETGERTAGPVETLLREAIAKHRHADGAALLMAVAALAPSFADLSTLDHLPSAVPHAGGPGLPKLICVSAVPNRYARFAQALDSMRDVLEITVPGNPSPAGLDVAAEALAEAIRKACPVEPYALVTTALCDAVTRAAAHRLRHLGVPACGIAVLGPDDTADLVTTILDEATQATSGTTDEHLATAGRYLRFREDPRPADPATPSLVVDAPQSGMAALRITNWLIDLGTADRH